MVELAVDGILRKIEQRVVHPAHIPLQAETQPPDVGGPRHTRPRCGLFGDGQHAGVAFVDELVQALQERNGVQILVPAIGVRNPFAGPARVVEVEHGGDGVHSKSVHVIFFQPEQGAVPKEAPHLRAAVVKDASAPIFNYSRTEVRSFLWNSALFWLEKYHVDGLRVDAVASMLYLDYSRRPGEWIPNPYGGNEDLDAISFLKRLNELIHERHPGVLTIAEESTAWTGVSRPTHVGGLGFSLKWNMGWMHDTLLYFSKDPVHRKFHHNNLTFSLLYAFTENFVLVLSHDEVVHGKRALLAKMPGDTWRQFANLRALYAFQYAHPGKKLLFMGGEFGQWMEWNANQSLDWNLLDYEPHRALERMMADLNQLYRRERAFYEVDFDWTGFEWVDFHGADESVIIFLRRARDRDDHLVVASNFTPVPRPGYRIGVPEACFYAEVLNTDAIGYGGSGLVSATGRQAVAQPWHNQPCSLELDLPPLSVVFLKPQRAL